jgi:hypothetical protein
LGQCLLVLIGQSPSTEDPVVRSCAEGYEPGVRPWLGAWPLSSLSDEFSESGIESGSDWWVDLSVGFPEHGFAVSVVFDHPSVFMEDAVVVSAEEDQIFQVGWSSVGPMCLVVGMYEVSGATTGELAATIPMPELSP